MDQKKVERAIITVGKGRGFVVTDPSEPSGQRLVITAAHCLPSMPPPMSISPLKDRLYQALLGPLGAEPPVWAECFFVDPIGDIAVLGSPDNEALSHEADRYLELTEAAEPLSIVDSPESSQAWLLSPDGQWFRCTASHNGGPLWLDNSDESIVGGMSGSPIVADDGCAIGVVCTGNESDVGSDSGPQPRLAYNLPVWFWPRAPSSRK
jgi:hypothetical protein